MDDVLDEIHDISILDEIATALRVDVFFSDGYRNLQMAYISENIFHPRSRESITLCGNATTMNMDIR
jgi:hypothetical protein